MERKGYWTRGLPMDQTWLGLYTGTFCSGRQMERGTQDERRGLGGWWEEVKVKPPGTWAANG